MAEVITELSVMFTADTSPVDKAAAKVRADAEKIERKPVTQTIDGDASALAAQDASTRGLIDYYRSHRAR